MPGFIKAPSPNDTLKDSTLLSSLIDGIGQVKSAAENVGGELGLQLDLKELILKLEPAVDVLNKLMSALLRVQRKFLKSLAD